MANPFLVLGGIAISVATAAFGILQVPGWVASAQDAAAVNDIAQVSAAQAAAVSERGKFLGSMAQLESLGSVKVAPSAGTSIHTAADTSGKHALTVSRSASGAFFARTSERADIGRGTTVEGAVTASGATIQGPANARVTGEGVPVPRDWQLSETVYENLFQNANIRSTNGFNYYAGEGGTTTFSPVTVEWAHSGSAVRFTQTRAATSGADGSHYDVRPPAWVKPNTRYTVAWDIVGQGKHRTARDPGAWPTPLNSPNGFETVAASSTEGLLLGSTPQRVWVTFETGPGIHPNLQLHQYIQLQSDDWVEFGNVQMYEGDYDADRPWFSGDRIADPGMKVAWSGDANSSTAYAYR